MMLAVASHPKTLRELNVLLAPANFQWIDPLDNDHQGVFMASKYVAS
jgi:hypothetical protein